MPRLVSVAVPVPSLDLLTYRVPDALPMPEPGARVLVPLGPRVITGCAIDDPSRTATAVPSGAALRDIVDVLDADAFLPVEVVALARWVSEYYACSPGEAIAAAMPPLAWVVSERRVQITEEGRAAALEGLAADILGALADGRATRLGTLAARLRPTGRGSRRPSRGMIATVNTLERERLVRILQPLRGSREAFKTVRIVSLTAQGHDAEARARLRLGTRQREALDRLSAAPQGLPVSHLSALGIAPQALARLAGRGMLSFAQRRVERDPFAGQPHPLERANEDDARALTTEQHAALGRLEVLAGEGRFRTALLHGVTGSGKTEVYLRLARHVVAAGRRVLVLVPEIGLTPAAAAAFRQAFGGRVAIQHSALSDGERHDQWHRIRRGDADVVVGTRSAVFAPLSELGLVVVDEEHDGSYKQEESPRYHGRDVAVMRGKQAGALVVLGSATPSLESYQNAVSGRYEHLTLERRVLHRPLAHVEIVDMREEYAAEGPDVVLSRPLRQALADRLARAEQALVLLNRRGFSTAAFCRQCGHTLECPNCSISLTIHRAERRARCHYCNHAMSVPKSCPACAGPYLEQTGFGTERVEREIETLLPGARVSRLDRDVIRQRGALVAQLGRFARGEIDVLVGTQMIAKGHDFPNVTLVGVVSADVGLGLADFRAAERTFQLLTQVAGRAGRGEAAGQAIVQTLYPHHYSIVLACRQDYPSFFREEMQYRQAMRYPPVVALVNAIVRGPTARDALGGAAEIVRLLRRHDGGFRVLGPAPAPLGRLKGEYRAQLFLKGRHRRAMRTALTSVLAELGDLRRRVVVDVDPVSVL